MGDPYNFQVVAIVTILQIYLKCLTLMVKKDPEFISVEFGLHVCKVLY